MSASVSRVEKTRNRSLNDDTPPNLVQMRERSVSEIILTVPVKERRSKRSNDNFNLPITVIEEESETDLGRLGSTKSLSAVSGTSKVQRVPSRNSKYGSHGNLSTISNNGFNRITGQRSVLDVPNPRQNGSIEGSVNTLVNYFTFNMNKIKFLELFDYIN